MKKIVILELDNGFVLPVSSTFFAQGGGAFVKQEIPFMIPEIDDISELEVDVLKIDRTVNLKDYLEE